MYRLMLLLCGALLVSAGAEAKYYGQYSSNPYGVDSVSNPYGTYGSQYSSNSINNPYSQYGNLDETDLTPGSGNYPKAIGTKTLKLYDSEGNFRGNLNDNPYDPDSIANPYGRYGSRYSADSINNPYGAGSRYKSDSPMNKYGTGWEIRDE